MKVKDILKIESLKGAKLIAGTNGTLNAVNGVNVLEALDIENWGRSGEVILSSFFALNNLSDKELEIFFQKLHDIGISAIIIKIERLVQHIPNKIIELCDKHLIPLIQIGKGVKYESIILEILGPIINRNMSLLNKYYEIHSELTSLALKMPSMDEILSEFKKMIQRDVTLINSSKKTEINTNPELCDVTIIRKIKVIQEKYMQFNYMRYEVVYNGINRNSVCTQIRVPVPYLGFNDYVLIIHELHSQISSEDFMIIENAVKFLQMELLKRYAVSQNLAQQKNNIVADLLHGRLHEKKDVDEVLESLNIYNRKYYRVILIKLYQRDKNKNLDKTLMTPILNQIKNSFKSNFQEIAYLERPDRIALVFNFDHNENDFNLNSIEKLMNSMAESNLFKEYYYCLSISSKVEKFDIPKANLEVLDTQKILRLFHNTNKILAYEDLGIYKLFLEADSLNQLEKFISPKLRKFRLDNPQLFETLEIFINTNQNYTLTSEMLFLHPKSVRYRIDKIKELLGIEFANPEEILQIQVASRLFKLTELEENK
jgi:PucR family transcriptional regulator, purine catabolism regulatory protein